MKSAVAAILALCFAAGCAVMSFAPSAHAASFDCTRAKTRVDHLICGNKALGSADDALDDAYHKAIDSAEDQEAVIQAQRLWLKQRDLCGAIACIAAAYHTRLEALKHVKRAGWKTYRDPVLGISFEYLANLHVLRDGDDISIVGRNIYDSDYFLHFEIVDGSLEEVAKKEMFERGSDGKWMANFGPGLPVEAQPFSGHGWRGMYATISCYVDNGEGGQALSDCWWAILSDDKRSAIMDMQGSPEPGDAVMHSIATFRFDR